MGVFDGLRARMDRLFAAAEGTPDPRSWAAGLQQAIVEARAGIAAMREALAATERELAGETGQLADAERRGGLAAQIGDQETVAVAERFATRSRERIAVLDRKLAVQRDELALAERETAEMTDRIRAARQGFGPTAGAAAAAWREIQAAGGTRPELDLEGELLKAQAERKLHEAAVEAQLAHLKKKLGKE